ncbi:AI-2E family transporter [Duganella qianjiadongensis]|uniref:AI-2E family transporter n=1 Tax=Duganella qianjiadongensis TaxID=2692176 RepID=A0ABW9VKG1_9BURK|nr:AI-2E family transporter [Duganella qianjiadongensis]MYM39009.1 AI-2E family transporter [Duganella qianjiadongensis]
MSSPSSLAARVSANSVVTISCVLALLYFGRDVLQPVALAAILSLLLAPMLQVLGRFGLRRLPAMLVTLALAGVCVVGTATVLATQLLRVSEDLPQYRAAIQIKIDQVRTAVERPFAHMQDSFGHISPLAPQGAEGQDVAAAGQNLAAVPRTDLLSDLTSKVWGPLGETGLVLVLLIFMVLEHESLQDRLIRLAGQREIGRTARALADAAQGVARFFFSQFVVNAAFGIAIGLSLWAMGLSHAVLWGTLSAVLRFVPYLGALVAGALIAGFAAAVDPGWQLALSCLLLFGVLELLVANVVEPNVYGHSTGLSPLAVMVSALFWGTLWGPIGLLMSTPLTVCLVVAGRHVPALEWLAILLGQAPDVTGAQRFYQRALNGDTGAILRDARPFLRRTSLARYCDQVLLPGLALAGAEIRAELIDASQREHLRRTVAEVAEALAPSGVTRAKRCQVSLLDANVGAHLRHLREARLGRWQGSLDVPQRSIILCVSRATEREELVSELLARALREASHDARSVVVPIPPEEQDPDKADLVSTLFIPYPTRESLPEWIVVVDELRANLPQALLATIRPTLEDDFPAQASVQPHVDMVLRSFEEALAFVAPGRS